MTKIVVYLTLAIACVWIGIGCATGGSPLTPSGEPALQGSGPSAGQQSSTSLWGLYEVYIDVPSKTVDAVLDRQAMFTANVVNFINGKPTNLSFKINDTPMGGDWVDVDIDVTITHPFPGLHQYDGYDVRGVFMGDGSASLEYNPDLIYPVLGTDQFMLADPDDDIGGPDGYTRWFNKAEFSEGGMPLFQYTPGKLAPPTFNGTATLNPYKYFADGLGADEDLWTWLGGNADAHGIFTSGAANTRNYYLRFPNAKGVKFGYAVTANWEGTDPEFHPSNAPEAIGCDVVDGSNVYYLSPSENGGDLSLDISIWDWDSALSGGVMEGYRIIIESTVLTGIHEFDASEMTATGGDENFSTYHVEVEADDVGGLGGNEYWVIVESPDQNYTNTFGADNLAGEDPLAAIFRYDLDVSPSPVNMDPECDLEIDPSTPVPAEDFSPVPVMFDASGSFDPDGDPLTFEWDFDGDGTYGEDPDDSYIGTPDKPTHGYNANYNGKAYVKVTDGKGGEAICSVDVQVTAHQSKNIALRNGVDAIDLGVDPSNGDLWIIYSDIQNWKYTLPAWYQGGASQYVVPEPGANITMMDVASGGVAMMMAFHPVYSPTEWIFNNTGGILMGMGWGGADIHFRDCTNYPTTGTFANDLMMFLGYFHTYYSADITMVDGYQDPTYGVPTLYRTETWVYPPLTGKEKVYQDYLVAIDSSVDGEAFWTCEHTDFYAARFKLNGAGWYKSQSYDNAYFGTGTEQTDDTCWTMDVVDMSRDKTGKFHVLDLVDGQAVIKEFDGSISGGTSYGHYGDETTISGQPVAIDGDDFGGRMFVLHGSSGTGYFLSIFQPSEFPV